MSLLYFILIIALILFFFSKKEERLMKYGRFKFSKHVTVGLHKYYVEEVEFDDYQDALQKYINISADITASDDVLDTKYDLYDWTFTIFRFKDKTIELKHLRNQNRIRAIKSYAPISIRDFEMDSINLTLV